VKVIKERAFAYCNALTSVTLPDSVEEIENGAFEDCAKLIMPGIPENVKFGSGVFSGCELGGDLIRKGVLIHAKDHSGDTVRADRGAASGAAGGRKRMSGGISK